MRYDSITIYHSSFKAKDMERCYRRLMLTVGHYILFAHLQHMNTEPQSFGAVLAIYM